MKKIDLYATKISVSEKLFSHNLSDLKQYILKAILESKGFIEYGDSIIGFTDINKFNIQRRILVVGKLCRGKDQAQKIIDSDSGELRDHHVPNVAHESYFLFDLKTEIVVFEERKYISKFQFGKMFSTLISYNQPNVGRLENKLLTSISILRQIDEFSEINYAKFNLIPANWDYSEEFDELDEKIKELEAEKAEHEYKSDGGLNKEAMLFKDSVNMGLSGYGDFKLGGKDLEGNIKEVYSEEEHLSQTIKLEKNNLDEFIDKALGFLFKAIAQHKESSDYE
ncbi:hypothetical protein [Selenihalanaerobacter shriftii]|uniref:Uncharacterized protein n=1 Tax=Selenihalanaerobacter shriftii TaxID=142842 RepID=A0A1T4PK79_9FIRM|nr:hypothetical protein [Selenihalanaerobacter shriftii]SJZ91973.1 hypothetical protein SAMN02745118_02211 [Selenihalanaerobacter shriftii]